MNNSGGWKVGPLAEASGVTVRTLHHWDAIGVLSPSRRTASGSREYTDDDLVRLYQVLALRSLGLSLESIIVCLDVGIDLDRVVHDHLAGVEASLAALERVRQKLVRLGAELATEQGTTPETLLRALRAIGGVGPGGEEVLRRNLDADQQRRLGSAAAALGPAKHYLLEIEWPQLYRKADRLRREGVGPADDRVRQLARRMDESSVLFTGDDAGISAGVRGAWRADPAAMSGDPAAPADEWRALADYLDRARHDPA
ncbi:MerR family transcriptional regulator [Nocardia sp. BSTN01]|uniref:MerR family transcriptional regulator n=1 Tax=Nocardia sp. BSTN01 TaxID=2783665 RepID=UPI0028155A26|nr:MerR family transcriptional regulator [Nocardia sp. BSTN01]